MASQNGSNGKNGSSDLEGLTFVSVDWRDRAMVAKIRERDLSAAEIRIKNEVQRLQGLGVIDSQGRRVNKGLPPDMCEESNTDFGG